MTEVEKRQKHTRTRREKERGMLEKDRISRIEKEKVIMGEEREKKWKERQRDLFRDRRRERQIAIGPESQ